MGRHYSRQTNMKHAFITSSLLLCCVTAHAQVKTSLLDAQQPATAAPNRVRDTTPTPAAPLGTLKLRRKFVNRSPCVAAAIGFRVVDITAATGQPGDADVRVIDAPAVMVTLTDGTTRTVQNAALDNAQTATPGRLNSWLHVAGLHLVPGATVNVQFTLGVWGGGSYRFVVDGRLEPSTHAWQTTGTVIRQADRTCVLTITAAAVDEPGCVRTNSFIIGADQCDIVAPHGLAGSEKPGKVL